MKERKFFELLNLYLDCEIDSKAASELESEILSNRERRRVYGDYCRIHRATRLAFERFRSAENNDESSEQFDGVHLPVSAYSGGRRRSKLLQFPMAMAVATGIAAAIAVAVVYVPKTPTMENPAIAQTESDQIQALPVVTFYAPFASDLRTDPYFRDARIPVSSPFAFASEPVVMDMREFPSSLQGAASFRLGSSSAVELDELEFERIQLGAPESRIFRSNPNAAPVSLQPVGFEVHR
jgi:hypothetical protein